ncbi:MAG: flotillin-like FloA family protein [Phycisphaerae bacterium]|nr:flotillin-like FloA family protein [Phycisphaerae bacterium]
MDSLNHAMVAQAQAGGTANLVIVIIAILAIVSYVILFLLFARFFSLWFQAYAARAGIPLTDLIRMRSRRVDLKTVVYARIQLVKAGIHGIAVSDIEKHYLAGGRVQNVVSAIIEANRAGIDLNWPDAAAIDLEGRDVLDEIRAQADEIDGVTKTGKAL